MRNILLAMVLGLVGCDLAEYLPTQVEVLDPQDYCLSFSYESLKAGIVRNTTLEEDRGRYFVMVKTPYPIRHSAVFSGRNLGADKHYIPHSVSDEADNEVGDYLVFDLAHWDTTHYVHVDIALDVHGALGWEE